MKKKNENRAKVRTEQITVVVTAGEKKDVEKFASELGVTMSTFVRLALKSYMKKGGVK